MKLFNLDYQKYSTSKKYLLIIIFFIGAIVYLYQEPILYGERLNIGDVRSQGIIFDQYKTDYLEKNNEFLVKTKFSTTIQFQVIKSALYITVFPN